MMTSFPATATTTATTTTTIQEPTILAHFTTLHHGNKYKMQQLGGLAMVTEGDDYGMESSTSSTDGMDIPTKNEDSPEESDEQDFVEEEGPDVKYGLGDWIEMHGNYVLRPPLVDQEPR
jgi:hypothetical protein